jgi:hypothetical protein
MSTAFIASIGILLPFIVFVVALFSYLHTLWVGNVADTPDAYSNVSVSDGDYGSAEQSSAASGRPYGADLSRRPVFATASRVPGFARPY